jgi:hypothetical protein
MAQVTSVVDATVAWVQIANAAQKFFISVVSAEIMLAYKSTSPTADDIGHQMRAGDTFGDTPTEKVWMRASVGTAKVVLTKD